MHRTAPLALLLALSACSFVGQDAYQNALCRLDEDGDGDPRCGISGTTADGDCDDSNPLMYNGNVETPYDGFDNDCRGGDLLDVDGDGFPGISREEYEALPDHEPWPTGMPEEVDCQDLPIDGFPKDYEALIHPGADEIWYDGLDGDCAGDDDFDQDRDGFAAAEHADVYTGDLPVTDCLDTNADVYPGSDVPNEPYTGIDQDCSGQNDFDPDGDGRLTPGYNADAATYASRYGYDLTWIPDADCMDIGDEFPEGLADPALASRTYRRDPRDEGCDPSLASCEDTWYDGYDDACDDLAAGRVARNDFDQDADGYLRSTGNHAADRAEFVAYVERYLAFTNTRGATPYAAAFAAEYGTTSAEIGAWFDLHAGDCDDTNVEINPEGLEVLGDGVDRDCDGDPDTTGFAYGDLEWIDPGPPRALATRDHVVLLAAAQGGIDLGDGFDVRQTRSVALSWGLDATSSTAQVIDEAPYVTTSDDDLLDAPISAVADGESYLTSHSWSATRTRLEVARSVRDLVSSANYRTGAGRVDSGTRAGAARSYLGTDLRCDSATDRCWVVSCDEDSMHFMSFDRSSSLTRRASGFDTLALPADIQGCIVLPSAQSGGAVVLGALTADGQLYPFEPLGEELIPATTDPFPAGSYDFVRSQGEWIVMGLASGGLRLFQSPGDSLDILTGTRFVDADAVVTGSGAAAQWTVAAVRPSGEVVLAYGLAGALLQVDLPIMGDSGPLLVDSVAVARQSDRVLIGVRGSDDGEVRIGWSLQGIED